MADDLVDSAPGAFAAAAGLLSGSGYSGSFSGYYLPDSGSAYGISPNGDEVAGGSGSGYVANLPGITGNGILSVPDVPGDVPTVQEAASDALSDSSFTGLPAAASTSSGYDLFGDLGDDFSGLDIPSGIIGAATAIGGSLLNELFPAAGVQPAPPLGTVGAETAPAVNTSSLTTVLLWAVVAWFIVHLIKKS